jgi:hypothetical protein
MTTSFLTVAQDVNTITWDEFRDITQRPGVRLLRQLSNFPNAVLVSGCQRSGTTMLSQILLESSGIVDYRTGRDSELNGALILSGIADHQPQPRGRYCFQTTYLNDHYKEYFEHPANFKIIWVLRNPASVVHSMLHNWRSAALDRLFEDCGADTLVGVDRWHHKLRGAQALDRLRRACWAYNGKTSQLFQLHHRLGPSIVMTVDYDDLVTRKATLLPRIYNFLGLSFRTEYLDKIKSGSLNKRSAFNPSQVRIIEMLCEKVYEQAIALRTLA